MGKKQEEAHNEQEQLEQEVTTEHPQENAEKTPEKEVDTAAEPIDETAKLQLQVSELKDKYLRLYAEFDNYKKRNVKEKIDMMKTAAVDTLSALLPVLDDFDRAKKNADDDSSTEVFSEGVSLVYNKLYSLLKQKGLEPMDSNGADFDPELHEAVTEIPAPTEEMKGKVIDTIEKGYRLNDKIIRYAKVVVGK